MAQRKIDVFELNLSKYTPYCADRQNQIHKLKHGWFLIAVTALRCKTFVETGTCQIPRRHIQQNSFGRTDENKSFWRKKFSTMPKIFSLRNIPWTLTSPQLFHSYKIEQKLNAFTNNLLTKQRNCPWSCLKMRRDQFLPISLQLRFCPGRGVHPYSTVIKRE